MPRPHRIAAWLYPAQAALVRAVARAADADITHAGTPHVGRSASLAAELAATPFDDLRAAVATLDVDALWLAAPAASGDDRAERAMLGEAAARGLRLVATEPTPSSPLAPAPDPPILHLGLLRHAPFWAHAADLVRDFGPVRMLHLISWSDAAHGSLGARLLSALDVAHAVIGEPEAIDAVYTGPRAASGVHAAVPDDLRDLHGDLAVTLRGAGAVAVLALSNAAGLWATEAILVSERGRLRITELGALWLNPDGSVHERTTRDADQGVEDFAAPLRLALAGAAAPLTDTALIHAHAALLAARTGQPESPDTLRRLAGR